MPALGRKIPVAFMRRVSEARSWIPTGVHFFLVAVERPHVECDWSSTRKSVSAAEGVTALTALRLFHSHRGVRVRLERSGAVIKAAYAVNYTPVREENNQETAPSGSSRRAALFTTENRV